MFQDHLKEGVREGASLWLSLVLGVFVFTVLYSVLALNGVSGRNSVLWSFPFLTTTLILTQVLLRSSRIPEIGRDYPTANFAIRATIYTIYRVVPVILSFLLGLFANLVFSNSGVSIWIAGVALSFLLVTILITELLTSARWYKH